MSEEITLNERIFQEPPTIGGKKARNYSDSVKLKLSRISRWIDTEDDEIKGEEYLFAFAYLVLAPIERVALNTLNKEAYFIDKEKFIGSLSADEIGEIGRWLIEVTDLEKVTAVEIEQKPSSGNGETEPPN